MSKFLLWAIALAVAAYIGLPSYYYAISPMADESSFECPPGRKDDPDLKAYRKEYGKQSPVIKVIKLLDSGELVDRCQWTDALYELVKVEREKFVVLYVHGWKHNSDPQDSDLVSFKAFVHRVAADESSRHVVGIYVGWDASTEPKWLENLTFWGRKRAADRISQSATLTKLIGAIDSIRHGQAARRARSQGAETAKLDPFIAMGHSFGARILFTATSQLLLYKVQMAYGTPYKVIRGPADMIVLINPALEASTYAALDSTRRAKEHFDVKQFPLLMSIWTAGDWATRVAFPLGQLAGLARAPNELTTLGNFPDYSTHVLAQADSVAGAHQVETPGEFCQSKICLVRKSQEAIRQQDNNPFLIVEAVPEVLKDHSDIWTEPFAGWLTALFKRIDHGRPNLSEAELANR